MGVKELATSNASVTTDLVVLGSGVAGLTAALTASMADLQVVVLEHTKYIGGTSARSSGTVWIPDNHYLRAHGEHNDRKKAAEYLTSVVAGHGDPSMWRAFLEHGPLMIESLDRHAGIRFSPYFTAPDYRQDHPGAASGGRALEPLPFDGRQLGADFSRLAWPLQELMLFHGMMITRSEAAQLLHADRSLPAAWLGVRLLGRYLLDRICYRRGTRLVLGNALVASLFKALLDREVPVWTQAKSNRLVVDDNQITGVKLDYQGKKLTVQARKGVILAGGGFPANPEWRAEHLPAPVAEHTPAASGCDGSTLDLAIAAGAALGPAGLDNALWFPSSISTRDDGATVVYPHIVLDRAKPGLIAVNQQGRRFVNEAVSYHEFVRAMYRCHFESPNIPAWLICDRIFIRRYGLGLIRPRTGNLRQYVANGYLKTAATISDLAGKIDMPAENLETTITKFNNFASDGVDQEFGKGENIYDQNNGDANVRPNPCLGPITTPPYYALQVVPTPLGTSRGLSVDTKVRVCNPSGQPIPGLYACGNDMQSAFGGEYPGAGAQLGQAMTFAWIAAHHAARSNNDVQGATIEQAATA